VLGDDVEARTIGLRRAAERSLPALSPETQKLLEAFAQGVNAWVAVNPLPPEYGALELTQFEEWIPEDSVVIAKALAFQLSFDLDINNTITFRTYAALVMQVVSTAWPSFSKTYFDPRLSIPHPRCPTQ
jgi:penicillin amidase